MTVKTFYWRSVPNFGDLLGPMLLKHFAHIDAQWAPAEEANVVTTGSVLDLLPKGWQGIVAGSGKLHEDTVLDLSNATVAALRGPLSAKGVRGNYVIGDPGLLADELVPIPEKEYNLGIVPHWTDRQLENDPRFTKYNPHVISVRDDPLYVIREIGKCKKIVSSSLHGIILADAFGIPRRIEMAPRMLSNPAQEGGYFKWLDYAASLDMDFEVGVTQEADRNLVMERQHDLFDVFQDIKAAFAATT